MLRLVWRGYGVWRRFWGLSERRDFGFWVQPSCVIHGRRDVLEEVDGRTLRHGLQGLEGQRILVPSRRMERPDVGRLGERWERFLGVGYGLV